MSKFKIGDRVKVVEPEYSLPLNSEWKILHTFMEDGCEFVKVHGEDDDWDQDKNEWFADRFELVDAFDEFVVANTSSGMSHEEMLNITPESFQGIAKPILEERKVGKVKMHLVDEGFPNAMMELGKMMGWAEEHKGYKPNDFKNLPNAEVEFSAAATRHRLKGFIQKADGVPAIDRVDEESGISHLCHAAFNCLAELELVLTGKIK